MRVNVEIKNNRGAGEHYDETGELAREVLSAIERSGSPETVGISSFDLTTCAFIRSMDEKVSVAWLLWGGAVGDPLIQAHVLGLNAVNPHFTTVDAEVVERARDLQLDVNVWTVNAREDLERMAAAGVACVITDEPLLALEVVGR